MGSSEGVVQDHSQWFSPLGSSASRFLQDASPSLSASTTAPAMLSDTPSSACNWQERDTASTRQESSPSRSTQQGSEALLAPANHAGDLHQQPHSSIYEQGDSASGLSMEPSRGQSTAEAPAAGAFGSWAAFSDSAQSAAPQLLASPWASDYLQVASIRYPELSQPRNDTAQFAMPQAPQHLHAAWEGSLQPTKTFAQTVHGTVPTQASAVPAGAPGALSDISSALPAAPSAPDQLSDDTHAFRQPQPWGLGGRTDDSKQTSSNADLDLLRWSHAGAHQPGQLSGGNPANAAFSHSFPGHVFKPADPPAILACTQVPAEASLGSTASKHAVPLRSGSNPFSVSSSQGKASTDPVPASASMQASADSYSASCAGKPALPPCRDSSFSSTYSREGKASAYFAPTRGAKQAPTEQILQASSTDNVLQALKQQVMPYTHTAKGEEQSVMM